jgi:hypothetical protein
VVSTEAGGRPVGNGGARPVKASPASTRGRGGARCRWEARGGVSEVGPRLGASSTDEVLGSGSSGWRRLRARGGR